MYIYICVYIDDVSCVAIIQAHLHVPDFYLLKLFDAQMHSNLRFAHLVPTENHGSQTPWNQEYSCKEKTTAIPRSLWQLGKTWTGPIIAA